MELINPYIHFNGNTEEAFTFYKSVFGGAFAKVMRYKTYQTLNTRYQKMMQIESCTLFYLSVKAMC
jgi:uncharacterized glyoxalase superfamily protein PhnB